MCARLCPIGELSVGQWQVDPIRASHDRYDHAGHPGTGSLHSGTQKVVLLGFHLVSGGRGHSSRFHVRPLGGCFKAGGISPQPPTLSLVQPEVTGVPLGGLIRGGLLFLFPDTVFPVIIHKPHLLQEAS